MSDVSPPALLGLEQIEERLGEPEPLCLALLVIEPRSAAEGTPWQPAPALVEAVTTRLRSSMRPYDELRLLADGRFAIILPTLAEIDAIETRMGEVFDVVDAPYRLAGTELRVRALLAAGVRAAGEPPTDFLARIVGGVETARDRDGRRPVVV